MAKPPGLRNMKRGRGNPDSGKFKPVLVLPAEFDIEVASLGLAKSQYVASAELRRWCDRNRNRVYIPDWLLAKWGMQVEAHWVDVA